MNLAAFKEGWLVFEILISAIRRNWSGLGKGFYMSNNYGLENHGFYCFVFVHGQTRQDVVEDFNGFYNHGAPTSDLFWLNEGIKDSYTAYFQSNMEKLTRCLFRRALFKILNGDSSKYKGVKGGARKEAEEMGEAFLDAMIPESVRGLGYLRQVPNENEMQRQVFSELGSRDLI